MWYIFYVENILFEFNYIFVLINNDIYEKKIKNGIFVAQKTFFFFFAFLKAKIGPGHSDKALAHSTTWSDPKGHIGRPRSSPRPNSPTREPSYQTPDPTAHR